MKEQKRTVTVVAKIDIPFHSYGNKTQDNRAEQCIKRWIREVLRNEASFIPLYVEKNPATGGYIEDCSQKASIHVSSSIEGR